MRYRQVHLDFHTSPLIEGIGSRFDAKAFAKAFKDAHVDSVTIFSKCHHGVSYHPTSIGKMHPHLDFDLTRAQMDALHAEGINVPVYLTATWDEYAAHTHPEWRTVAPDHSLPMWIPEHGNGVGWAFLDFASPYLDYLVAQTEEVMERFPDADGIFMDIAFQLPSISAFARDKMDALGLDWTDPADQSRFMVTSVDNFFARIRDAVKKHDPNMRLFFNSGHIRRGMRQHYADYYSHLEIESLPTAGWGYEHFPLSARYVDPLGTEFLGQTGKFHTHWGEVGGYKTPEALIYECAAMMSHGARCLVGDHLHPTGSIDTSTMDIIGKAYDWVEAHEPWARDSINRADIALLSAEAASHPVPGNPPGTHDSANEKADEGAVRLLLEAKFAFDVIDLESDPSAYKLVILPDIIAVDDQLRARLDAYVAQGGRVLMTGKSGIGENGFLFDVGADWKGTSENDRGDFLLPIEPLRASFVGDPLFMYRAAERITVTNGVSLGEMYEPYFNRSPRHFSGHVNAASKPEPSGFAAGVQKGGFTYLSFPIFTCYFEVGAVAMLEIAEKLIDFALGTERLMRTSLPRAGRISVRSQEDERRDVVYLLHANPSLRGNHFGAPVQPIQDIVTLSDIAVDLAVRGEPASVRIVPGGEDLPFSVDDGRVRFVVPRLTGQEMIELAYT